MGCVSRMRCADRIYKQCEEAMQAWHDEGYFLLEISGGIPSLLRESSVGTGIMVIDIDNVQDEECHMADNELTQDWYESQWYRL